MAGYIGKSQGVTQVDGYNRTEADDRYVNASGDTMTGQLDTPYQVIKGDIDYIGMSIRNTKANYSTSFIDAQNRTNAADSHIFFHHETDGSSTISFGTQPAGDFTDRRISGRMLINGNGHVTMPYQVGFYTRRSIGGDGRPFGAQEWSVSGIGSYNTGGHFNASNGRFTAPVSGKYFFAAAPGYKQTGIDYNFYFQVNGVNAAEPVRYIGISSGNHSTASGSFVISLNAGDYVNLYINYTHHANMDLNYFCGYLIG